MPRSPGLAFVIGSRVDSNHESLTPRAARDVDHARHRVGVRSAAARARPCLRHPARTHADDREGPASRPADDGSTRVAGNHRRVLPLARDRPGRQRHGRRAVRHRGRGHVGHSRGQGRGRPGDCPVAGYRDAPWHAGERNRHRPRRSGARAREDRRGARRPRPQGTQASRRPFPRPNRRRANPRWRERIGDSSIVPHRQPSSSGRPARLSASTDPRIGTSDSRLARPRPTCGPCSAPHSSRRSARRLTTRCASSARPWSIRLRTGAAGPFASRLSRPADRRRASASG